MRKLLCFFILILSNLQLLSSERPNMVYTKDTCNRTYHRDQLCTDEERERCEECSFSRWEVRDNATKKYIAHVAYVADDCWIKYLRVDEEYRKQGIARELVYKAIEDMRTNYHCGEISLDSALSAREFWRRLGAECKYEATHVFRNNSSK